MLAALVPCWGEWSLAPALARRPVWGRPCRATGVGAGIPVRCLRGQFANNKGPSTTAEITLVANAPSSSGSEGPGRVVYSAEVELPRL